MGKRSMISSDDLWDEEIKAVKEFTDREDPQEAFERKIKVLNEDWKHNAYVLCYYGIGGIGKTSFVNKLCKVIRGVEGNECRLLDKIDCDYVKYDFNANGGATDKLSILLSLRKQLKAVNKDFQFYRFDSAIVAYSNKMGIDVSKDEETQSILESNPWLNVGMTVASGIPIVGTITDTIEKFDKVIRTINNTVKSNLDKEKYKNHLLKVYNSEASELLQDLHYSFGADMRHNMQEIAKRPIVVFLDTYEKYVDTLNREKNMIVEDYWFRKGARSLIRTVPGLLWVITGREKLYWAEDDTFWGKPPMERPLDEMTEVEKEELAEELLEQHLLGDLSIKDAKDFLNKAGIKDDQLCGQIYTLTSGTPLFLDICVDTYNELIARGITPVIEEFGEDLTQLIHRYLSNMHPEVQEMAYFLACLGTWTDKTASEVAKQSGIIRDFNFSKKYEDFVKHSFIICNQDGSYYMHETVKLATLKNVGRDFYYRVINTKTRLLKESLENNTTLAYSHRVSEYVKTLVEADFEYSEMYEHMVFAIRSMEHVSTFLGEYELLCALAKELFCMAKDKFPDSVIELLARGCYGDNLSKNGLVKEAAEIVKEIPGEKGDLSIEDIDWLAVKRYESNVYYSMGWFQKSFELRQEVFAFSKSVHGEEHPDTLRAMSSLAVSYSSIGNEAMAVELMEQMMKISRMSLGEDHPVTFLAIHNLANYYSHIRNATKAIELYDQVFEYRKNVLGADHPATLGVIGDLANAYRVAGKTTKAIELFGQVLEYRKNVLGEEHPATLSTMNNLAVAYSDIGKEGKSIELHEQVLECRKNVLGEEHPATLSSMNNVAISCSRIGNESKAIQIAEQVLELRKKVLGELHPTTLNTMHNLAVFYNRVGNEIKSIEIEERVLELSKEVLVQEHPDILQAKHNIAISYSQMGDEIKAIAIYEQILNISENVLGKEHPDVLSVMQNMALSYSRMGNENKSIEIKEQVLELRKKVLGELHPATIKTLYSLATTYRAVGCNLKSLDLFKQLLELYLKVYGEEHSRTQSVRKIIQDLSQ